MKFFSAASIFYLAASSVAYALDIPRGDVFPNWVHWVGAACCVFCGMIFCFCYRVVKK